MAVNFGRPDIEEFITETVQGTAVVAQWAPPADSSLSATPRRPAPVAEDVRPPSVRSLRQVSLASLDAVLVTTDRGL